MTVQRSRPGFAQVMAARCISRPRGLRSTAVAPTLVRPSMNTCAVTSNGSPSSTRAGNMPCSALGVTSMTTMRPNCSGEVTGMVGAGPSPAAIDFAAVEFAVAAVWVLVVRLRVLLFGAGFSLVVRLEALLFVAIQPIVGAGVPTVGRGCGIWTRASESRHRRVLRLWICGRSTDAAAVECAQPQQRVVHNTPASLIVRPHLHEPLPCRAQPWQARE